MLNILNNSILMKITVIDTIRSTIFISQILKNEDKEEISIVVINGRLDKDDINKIAKM